jgi:hypothetical protein
MSLGDVAEMCHVYLLQIMTSIRAIPVPILVDSRSRYQRKNKNLC